MQNNIFELMNSRYDTLSKSHKKLVKFVIDNPEFVVNKSITEVAEACKVGEATISRFCKSLDLKNYQEFKLSIARIIAPVSPGNASDNTILKTDSISTVARKILSTDISALKETLASMRESDIDQAVTYLLNAKRVVFFGVGRSFSTALEGYTRFARISPNFQIITETHTQLASSALMDAQDVAVIISYSGSTKEIVEIAKEAKRNNTRVIAVTHYKKSPLTSYSDIVLICSSDEISNNEHIAHIELSQLFILDILYTEYFRRTQETSSANHEKTTAMLLDKLY